MHMPPPVHGAAVVGQQIHDSQLIRDNFECAYINASTSTALDNVGHFSLKKISRTLSFYGQVLKTLRDQQPDLVYFTPSTSGWAFYRDVLTIRLLKRRGQNILLHLHNKPNNAFLYKWYNRPLWRHFFSGVSVIFLGDVLAKQCAKFTSLSKHVYICPNGIPDRAGNRGPGQSKTSQTPFAILFLSNMIETKGVYDLLEACAILKRKGYVFHCDFVGQWFDVAPDTFTDKCRQLDIEDRVSSYGAKYGDEKEQFLRRADVLVFPTYYPAECLPLVVIEAMQYALPIISTSEGAISSIIEDGTTGCIVEKRNVIALAEKLEYLLTNPQECISMGVKGRDKFEKCFTIEVFEKQILSIFQACMKDNSLYN